MEYVQLSMDEYIQSKNDIKNNLGGIVKSFVRIGWQLTRIDRSGAYKNDGYSSIAEFAATEYGMNRTGVSRFMNVYETYSADGDTPELKEQYREFKFSQLTELLQVQEADRQMFTPEVKREDIREFRRFEKENEADPARLLDWKDAKSPEEKLKATWSPKQIACTPCELHILSWRTIYRWIYEKYLVNGNSRNVMRFTTCSSLRLRGCGRDCGCPSSPASWPGSCE